MCSNRCAKPVRPGRFVRRADVIPEVHRHHRQPVVLDEDHVEPFGSVYFSNSIFGMSPARDCVAGGALVDGPLQAAAPEARSSASTAARRGKVAYQNHVRCTLIFRDTLTRRVPSAQVNCFLVQSSPMARYTLVYGVRLIPEGTLKGLDDATLTLADGTIGGLTLHTFDGTIPQLRRSLDRSLDAFFDLLPGADEEDVEKFAD